MPRRLPDSRFKGKKLKPVQNRMRLFLAIFPPPEYIAYFRDVIRLLDKQKRNLKPIPVDQIHLTLKFIGAQVSYESKDLIYEELSRHSGNFPVPEIKIKRIQFGFRYQTDPRNLLADLMLNDNLVELSDIVHGNIRSLRLHDTIRWKEKHTNDFHITLARLKPSASRSIGKDVSKIVSTINLSPPEAFTPEHIDMVESVISPQGPEYRRIGRIKL
jgi:2'-5' RNA ligase